MYLQVLIEEKTKVIIFSPMKSPQNIVPITGTPVFWFTLENILNTIPSCANAYNNRGGGSKDATVQPKRFH